GEAAGRRAEVRADFPADVDPKPLQRMRELHAPPPDPGMLEGLDRQDIVRRHERPRLVDVIPVHEDPPGHDQRLRLRTGIDEAALEQGDVEALAGHALRRVKPSWPK